MSAACRGRLSASMRLGGAACVLALTAGAARAQGVKADLVLKNAVVHTLDALRPRAEAVAVRGNRIAAVGTNAAVQALVGPSTRVLDLRGQAVIPAFQD